MNEYAKMNAHEFTSTSPQHQPTITNDCFSSDGYRKKLYTVATHHSYAAEELLWKSYAVEEFDFTLEQPTVKDGRGFEITTNGQQKICFLKIMSICVPHFLLFPSCAAEIQWEVTYEKLFRESQWLCILEEML